MQLARTHKFLSKQTGSTLIVTLIILILVMLLGVTALSTSDTQAKLTGNLQFENEALNAAEAALAKAEDTLYKNPNAGVYPQTAVATAAPGYDPLASTAWQAAGSEVKYIDAYPMPLVGTSTKCKDVTNPHNYACVNVFLVTAIGIGSRGASKIVQSYFAVPLH